MISPEEERKLLRLAAEGLNTLNVFMQRVDVKLKPGLASPYLSSGDMGIFMKYIKPITVDNPREPADLLIIDCIVLVYDPIEEGAFLVPMDSRFLEPFSKS